MTCSGCGAAITPGARFCAGCGSPLTVLAQAVPSKSRAGLGCLIAIGALVIIGGIGSYLGSKSQKASARPTQQTPSVGDTVAIKTSWPCASSKAALDEITKWAALKDTREMARTIITTRSLVLTDGLEVKILDWGFFAQKIRVTAPIGDPRTGRVCWVASEALR